MTRSAVLRLNGALLALIYLASILTYRALPERIPIHFGVSGAADAWVRRSLLSWLTFPLVSTAMSALLYALGNWTARRPELWNVPEKARFLRLSDAARAPVIDVLLRFLAWVATALTAFLGIVQLAIFQVAIGRNTRLPWYFAASLICTIAFILVGALRLNGRIRETIIAADSSAGVMR